MNPQPRNRHQEAEVLLIACLCQDEVSAPHTGPWECLEGRPRLALATPESQAEDATKVDSQRGDSRLAPSRHSQTAAPHPQLWSEIVARPVARQCLTHSVGSS